MTVKHVLIIADIEGSSRCWTRSAAEFRTDQWAQACQGMSIDIDLVARALFTAGVDRVTVKDFHRTAYNLLPEIIDPRVDIRHGYYSGPVPGIGDCADVQVVMMIGFHAASGTEGFLAHTLTSRLSQVEVNGRMWPEAALFAASLAPFNVKPVFFSGCPAACAQAREFLPGIVTYALDKNPDQVGFDEEHWRAGLVKATLTALDNHLTEPYTPNGPFRCKVRFAAGPREALKNARRWDLVQDNDQVIFNCDHVAELYLQLIRICYLHPLLEWFLPVGLKLFNWRGERGLEWARRRLQAKKSG